MGTLHESMLEYKKQLKKGAIVTAYRGLMQYMMDLRTHLSKKYPDYVISGSLYSGYMDMTYFAFSPQSLKNRGLKVAIVFVHETFRFEVWLSAFNKQIQTRYWKMFKESGWDQYHVVPTLKGMDSIVEHILVDNPDFRDLDALSGQIERGTLQFVADIEEYLLKTSV